jgi:hypothetical protein
VLEEAAPLWESQALQYGARKLVRKLRKNKNAND